MGQLIISALFGLSLALLFNRVCKENCVLYFAPKYDDIDNKIFKLEDTCYKYKTINVGCNENPIYAYNGSIKPSNQIEDKWFFEKIFA
jgi:hypothetical protein